MHRQRSGPSGLPLRPRVPGQGLEPPLDPSRVCVSWVGRSLGVGSPKQSIELLSLWVGVGRLWVCACPWRRGRLKGEMDGGREKVCFGEELDLILEIWLF